VAPARRARAGVGGTRKRHVAAAATDPAARTYRANAHGRGVSVPAAIPCTVAAPKIAYVAQWRRRQFFGPMRLRIENEA
jgi:hypothetical protein